MLAGHKINLVSGLMVPLLATLEAPTLASLGVDIDAGAKFLLDYDVPFKDLQLPPNGDV